MHRIARHSLKNQDVASCRRGWGDADSASRSRKQQENSGYELGAKIPPNYFQDFMCFLMVPACRTLAMTILAICCEYQTSDMLGRLFFSVWYSFCQFLYMACVSSLRASRLVLVGV